MSLLCLHVSLVVFNVSFVVILCFVVWLVYVSVSFPSNNMLIVIEREKNPLCSSSFFLKSRFCLVAYLILGLIGLSL